jgi:hypothetical protein
LPTILIFSAVRAEGSAVAVGGGVGVGGRVAVAVGVAVAKKLSGLFAPHAVVSARPKDMTISIIGMGNLFTIAGFFSWDDFE